MGPPTLLAAQTGLLTSFAGAEEALQDVAVRKEDPQDHLGQDLNFLHVEQAVK